MVRVLLDVPSPSPRTLRVAGERFHHLGHVLRLEPGDALEVFDGKGHAWSARVTARFEEAMELELGDEREQSRGVHLTLLQGLPKGDKLEWILQKGTELGADAFRPVATARAVVKLTAERGAERVKRWARICEEAARQCGRSDVPEVHPPMPLMEAVKALPPGPDTVLLVLDEEERGRPLREVLHARAASARALAVVIGPEGGLAREERESLVAQGGIPVTLGRNVLRTETAALAALVLLRHHTGELG